MHVVTKAITYHGREILFSFPKAPHLTSRYDKGNCTTANCDKQQLNSRLRVFLTLLLRNLTEWVQLMRTIICRHNYKHYFVAMLLPFGPYIYPKVKLLAILSTATLHSHLEVLTDHQHVCSCNRQYVEEIWLGDGIAH